MASTKLSPEEAAFIQSLRRLVARGGSLPVQLAATDLAPVAPASKAVQPVPTVNLEPRSGYWTQNAEFSRVRSGLYPTVPGSEAVLENLKLPGPPRGRGVSLTRREVRVGAPSANLNYFVYADIIFGIGGSITTVRIDWCDNIVNVPASTIRVDAVWSVLNTQAGAFPYSVGSPVEVSGHLGVQLCTDPLVSKGYNTYTQLVTDPSTAVIDVPEYAIGFWMGFYPGTALSGVSKFVKMLANTVYNGIPGPVELGAFSSQQIVDNSLTALNSLPPNCKQLDFSQSGFPSASLPIIWALSI
jgi:hypothetical protein